MSLTLRDVMTGSPHTIGEQQPLSKAHELMQLYGIRHLPVLRGGELTGLLSLRDLHLIEAMRGVKPTDVEVSEAMSGVPFAVDADTPLLSVAETMEKMKYGSAVALSEGKVVGVFTTVDAMRTLATFLRADAPATSPAPRRRSRSTKPPAKTVAR